MAENQAQTKPQFILWVKEAGIFRPAEVKFPEIHDWYNLTYDLMRNCEIGTEDISPNSLNLISSVYLGPIRILEEVKEGNIIQKDTFLSRKEFRHNIVKNIVHLARQSAGNYEVPYFSVVNVISPVEKSKRFEVFERTKKGSIQEEIEKYRLFNDFKYDFDKLTKPLEFILHPTAQLYVPRK